MFRGIGALLVALGIIVAVLGVGMNWGDEAVYGGTALIVAGAVLYKLLSED